MNEDFGVGPKSSRRRVISFDAAPRQASIDISKYQPSYTLPDEPQALAIAADDPNWNRDTLPDPVGSDSDDTGNSSGSDKGSEDPEDPKEPWYKRIKTFLASLSRKQWLIIGGVLLILIAGVTSYILTRPDKVPETKITKSQPKATPPPPPVSPLTGLETTEQDTKRPVIGVMIENSTFARPQAGLHQAGVVYEAIAEYGITRFLALYQEANPDNVGPVRSARPYYVDWARGYDAAYSHVGGSPEALAKIKADGVRDLDQFANSSAYRRIDERDAPHNVYTTMGQLRELTASKGWDKSTFTGLVRKKEAKAATATAQRIDIGISGPTYNVHYDYDAASNSYLRTMGGAPHSDVAGTRIAPKVVIGLATQYGILPDGYHSSYAVTGTGSAKVFQDGTVTEATWTRDGTGQYKFTDAGGKELGLNPGQTWITVVGDPAAITYAAPDPAPAPAP